ncbi:M10 family metallopeptidase C-terminal domain-containing protein [Belnapia sp. T18]|uniref:M10 family metallopeptidase C-terminal domain-containing protein n=1 Tax=Belnapia arida TaxID=2804533 RepID=A0ABS1U3T2_9PROT|nr:M10 family metallopeptidase C-terminal domain-containing protein [Belnapia arida]MBL6079328.1 M10 family metallopeptidase C-terminal domain-containing protein [Belnapia arida]
MADFDPLLAYLDNLPTARWNHPDAIGTPAAVTYSFMQAVPAYDEQAEHPGFAPLDGSMQAAARAALGAWAAVANLTFTEVPDAGRGGEIRIGSFDTMRLGADSPLHGAGGYSYYPTFVDGKPVDLGGDVYLGRYAENVQTAPGQYGLETLTHEIGHAIGLKHPFDGNLTLPAAEQDLSHSIMNYSLPGNATVVSVTGTAEDYSYVSMPLYPSGPMLDDIAAVQALYGANMAHAAGNDTYAWAANARFFQTIWDAGGADTIDTSDQVLDSVIDLRAGYFSSIAMRGTVAEKRLEIPAFATEAPTPTYDGHHNLAIAYGAVIENAKGGAGDDSITGNAAANTLDGGAGKDRLDGGDGGDTLQGRAGDDSLAGGGDAALDRLLGGDGNDTLNGAFGRGEADWLTGGAGNDAYVVDTAQDVVTEAAGQGTDMVRARIAGGTYAMPAQVENLVLEGSTRTGQGNALDNLITGNAGANWLTGGAGADTLDGGRGNDVLVGGTGADSFVIANGTGADRISDFVHGADHVRLVGFGGLRAGNILDRVTDQDGGAVVALDAGDSIVLTGIAKSALSASDFVFA